MEDSKLENFLNIIHMEMREDLKDVFLKKVIVNKEKERIKVFLECSTMISLDSYLALKDSFESYFNSSVFLFIVNNGNRSLYLDEYFKYFLPSYIDYFQDRLKVNGENNNYVVVYNHGEQKQLEEYLEEINTKLKSVGYLEISILLDEESRKETVKQIADDFKKVDYDDLSSIPVASLERKFTRRKRIKTIDDENVYYGDLINGDPISLSNIVLEDNDLIVECEIFGVDVFESSKSNFKIITLKITDYTDSMYAKIFLNDSLELERLVKLIKSGKWYKFFGYTKIDPYVNGEVVFNVGAINV